MRFFAPRRPWLLVIPFIFIGLLGIGFWNRLPQAVPNILSSPQVSAGQPTRLPEDQSSKPSDAIRLTGVITISGAVTRSQTATGLRNDSFPLARREPVLKASQPEPDGTIPEGKSTHPVDAEGELPSITEFTRQVVDGFSGVVRGIYVPDRLALRIIQQPAGQPGYIAQEDGTATQFQNAAFFGVVGLLAHNFLSGGDFLRLEKGQQMSLIFGDGKIQNFRITEIDDFQRLSPNDLDSDFVELANGVRWTVDQVFTRFYRGSPRLILQTCIERGSDLNWGVRFIVAEPQ